MCHTFSNPLVSCSHKSNWALGLYDRVLKASSISHHSRNHPPERIGTSYSLNIETLRGLAIMWIGCVWHEATVWMCMRQFQLPSGFREAVVEARRFTRIHLFLGSSAPL